MFDAHRADLQERESDLHREHERGAVQENTASTFFTSSVTCMPTEESRARRDARRAVPRRKPSTRPVDPRGVSHAHCIFIGRYIHGSSLVVERDSAAVVSRADAPPTTTRERRRRGRRRRASRGLVVASRRVVVASSSSSTGRETVASSTRRVVGGSERKMETTTTTTTRG